MATLHELNNGWHPGELAMHKLLHVPTSGRANPTSTGIPVNYALRIAASPLVAFGALDDEGRPWTTVWGGERGFAQAVAQGILGAQSLVDRHNDPVVQALLGSTHDGELVRPGHDGRPSKMMSGLSIDLESRDRVKIAGQMAVGSMMETDGNNSSVAQVQLAMQVHEILGNCPKYLNKKEITPHVPTPQLVSDTTTLPKEALDLIGKADLIFISSTNGETMDTNHRGGPPGFVRVVSNTEDSVVIVYPEYSGNRLYQTLGNLYTNPKIGVVIPDFDSSDVLYLSGVSELLVGQTPNALLPHVKLAVKITVTATRFVKDGLPFKGNAGEYSPYNPPVRRLATEQQAGLASDGQNSVGTAKLVKREQLTPTVNRYTFTLQTEPGSKKITAWKRGQHITLDFSPELDHGWSHMRDNDPQSLNDDFIRTFTVSNPPPSSLQSDPMLKDGTELEITLRQHGPATSFLSKHNMRVPLEIPIVGFGGEDAFRIPLMSEILSDEKTMAVFIAAGVGITPFLAQAPALLAAVGKDDDPHARLLWGLRADDLQLAVDTLERIHGVARFTTIFVSGTVTDASKKLMENIEAQGAQVVIRRMGKEDLFNLSRDRDEASRNRIKYYVCTSPEMLKVLTGWLEGQEVVTESFNY